MIVHIRKERMRVTKQTAIDSMTFAREITMTNLDLNLLRIFDAILRERKVLSRKRSDQPESVGRQARAVTTVSILQ
jgi:hypothetical protein